ncbi:hypothetical protein HY624_02990 [Candidatus Uhrbacteria bacterium]|nr:hypothetical protein [Candidatus Uhrbacteria bacterium]
MIRKPPITLNFILKRMHKEILTETQIGLLSLAQKFSPRFGLVGGTAIALHLGHRRSIDFDLFTETEFKTASIRSKILRYTKIDTVFKDEEGQLTLVINGVRFTFFHYPFPIAFSIHFGHWCRIPDLLTLAAMKAYALGHRAKWKDYVDLYFIIKRYHGVGPIGKKAKEIFGNEFNEKIFRVQLAYFKDIDYSEEIIYMKGYAVPDATVRRELQRWSIA